MPRKKWTLKELLAIEKDRVNVRRTPSQAEVDSKARARAQHLKQRQPVVDDIFDNGDFAYIEFTRNNGERVIGIYKKVGWTKSPAGFFDREGRKAIEKQRRLDAAEGLLQQEPGKTPLS